MLRNTVDRKALHPRIPSYEEIPGFEPLISVEYGHLNAIFFVEGHLCFTLEVLLHEQHPDYSPPALQEFGCFQQRWLCFPNVRDVKWLSLTIEPAFEDENGPARLGENWAFWPENGAYHLSGDWGEVRIESDIPLVLKSASEFRDYRRMLALSGPHLPHVV
jgi:hypothetical protein